MLCEDETRYKMQFVTISKALCDVGIWDVNQIYRKDIDNKAVEEKFMLTLLEAIKKMTPSIKCWENVGERNFGNFGRNIVDGVYHYYLAERVFNFNLYFNLLENIKKTEERSNYRLRGSEILKILATCKELPNPFSRTYFLRFALDYIGNNVWSYDDFWLHHKMERRDTIVDIINEKIGFQLGEWLLQFEKFVDFMTKYVFPIYDWCFLTMLLAVVENQHPKETHKFHMLEARELLYQYIKDNYKSIMQPIVLDTIMQTFTDMNCSFPENIWLYSSNIISVLPICIIC